MERTYRLDRLYYKFLRPLKIHVNELDALASLLLQAGFIKLENDRYTETEKLLSRNNRDELFKLIHSLKMKRSYDHASS